MSLTIYRKFACVSFLFGLHLSLLLGAWLLSKLTGIPSAEFRPPPRTGAPPPVVEAPAAGGSGWAAPNRDDDSD